MVSAYDFVPAGPADHFNGRLLFAPGIVPPALEVTQEAFAGASSWRDACDVTSTCSASEDAKALIVEKVEMAAAAQSRTVLFIFVLAKLS
ncbi:hypothetical protein [Paraburkholderia phenazinium]|jgi:hypothetical protein|uniref:hypothetical protein n=1 Tax=Paraburkholderia phenazinium TaxID=60549 RepID=UPI001FC88DE4|nr:hypothetical protein [Paraburkholderia phenazinium]